MRSLGAPFSASETLMVEGSSLLVLRLLVAQHGHYLHGNAHNCQNRVNHPAQQQAGSTPDRGANFRREKPHIDSKNLERPDRQNWRRHEAKDLEQADNTVTNRQRNHTPAHENSQQRRVNHLGRKAAQLRPSRPQSVEDDSSQTICVAKLRRKQNPESIDQRQRPKAMPKLLGHKSSLKSTGIPLDAFLDSLFLHPPHRVEGTSVFMVANTGSVPNALLHNLLHNKVLHQRVMFLNVEILTVPAVPERDRLSMESLGNGCWRVKLRFGFKDVTDVPKALELCRAQGLDFRMMETSFFLNRETIIATPGGGMAQWRERLFSAMARNATSAVEYFHIPTNRVIELGTQVEI